MAITVQFLMEDMPCTILANQPIKKIEWHFTTRDEAREATGMLISKGLWASHKPSIHGGWTVSADFA